MDRVLMLTILTRTTWLTLQTLLTMMYRITRHAILGVVTRKTSMSSLTRTPRLSRLRRQTTQEIIASMSRKTGAPRLIIPRLARMGSPVDLVCLVALVILPRLS